MQGLGFIQTSSGLLGSGLKYNGDLNLVQKQALSHKGRDNRFQNPIFNSNRSMKVSFKDSLEVITFLFVFSLFAEDFDFQTILTSYSKRNLTVRLENDYLLWDHGNGKSFNIDLTINYPVQVFKKTVFKLNTLIL